MTTKKPSTKQTAATDAAAAPSYGKKSEPPHKAVKDMMSKQSEASSKDTLHKAPLKAKKSK